MNKVKRILSPGKDFLGRFTFSRCMLCGQVVSRRYLQYGCCLSCNQKLQLRRGGYCPQCGAIYANEYEKPFLCLECREKQKPWDEFGFFQRYTGLLRDLILSFKFQGNLGFTTVLQSLIQSAYDYHLSFCSPDIIVPVPVGSSRLGERGFNQCLELVRNLSKYISAKTETRALHRIRETKPQIGLDYKERWSNLDRALAADEKLVKDKRILLVDDIYTTGSTLCSCTDALNKAGAAQVYVLVLARSSQN